MSADTEQRTGVSVEGRRRGRRLHRRVQRDARPRAGKHAESGHELGTLGGLAALSLDALSSVAYGPEAMMLVLVTAGVGALTYTVPLTIVITAMLFLLVVSYTQVISAHPEGGGAYSVSKAELGYWPSLLAAASVVVDYVLTVAVSLAAGAASLGSVFPGMAHHLLLVSLVGLVILTAVNMFGIAESARLLMVPTAVFIISILATIVVGALRSHPVAHIGTPQSFPAEQAVGILLILKAFASGCSAVTGVEAISNGVPAFRKPRVRTRAADRDLARRAPRRDAGRAGAGDQGPPRRASRRGHGAGPGDSGSVRDRLAVLRVEHRGRARSRPRREHELRRPAGPDEPAGQGPSPSARVLPTRGEAGLSDRDHRAGDRRGGCCW